VEPRHQVFSLNKRQKRFIQRSFQLKLIPNNFKICFFAFDTIRLDNVFVKLCPIIFEYYFGYIGSQFHGSISHRIKNLI
jgi:hypothetical protein